MTSQHNSAPSYMCIVSPVYENSFRFESMYHRGWYVGFVAPHHLRLVTYQMAVDDDAVIDFMLVRLRAAVATAERSC